MSASSASTSSSDSEPSTSHTHSAKRKRVPATSSTSQAALGSDSDGDSSSSDSDGEGAANAHVNSNDDSDSDSEEEEEEAREASLEVQALSHAERRRQKKKERKAATKAGSDDEAELPSKKRKLNDGTTEKGKDKAKGKENTKDKGSTTEPKRQNSVWVGNLAFKTTPDDIRNFFSSAGEITRINMPMKPAKRPGMPNENTGFAYVDFSTVEAKVAAIALSEKPLTGRKLLIKDGGDFKGRPAPGTTTEASVGGDSKSAPGTGLSKTAHKILRAQKQPPAPTLFLGNLGFETTVEGIRSFFEAHRAKSRPHQPQSAGSSATGPGVASATAIAGDDGDGDGADADHGHAPNATAGKDPWIRKVRMGTFEDSGLCKGFAFVDFVSVEGATSALVNPRNHTMDGRKLVVEYASAEAVRRGGGLGGPKVRKDGSMRKDGHSPSKRQPSQSHASSRPRGEARYSQPEAVETATNTLVSEDKPSGEQATKWTGAEAALSDRSGGKDANRGRTKGPRARPKPGAALALAKRESAAILPSQGKKIVF
ncbi:hypothetical protein HGRIS_010099 [Hohenbuehelia grisea]|uniref:RRM domain-containing protein n=1 Tax=Hohenbuehelia grisea TaxID=104357 RepID=A0ABR3J3M3_9AGAR